MSKHTPGPWRIGKNYGSVVCDTPVPDMGGSDWVEYYGGHLIAESVTQPNARLIAAAPDLLAALERIADETAATWVCDVARAAIAKATGAA